MTKSFQTGTDKGGSFKLLGAMSFTILDVIDSSFDEETETYIVRTASMGGRTSRTTGFGDSKGTVTCEFDGLVPPYATAPSILSGNKGTLKLNVNTAGGGPFFFSVGIVVRKVHYTIPSAGKVTYSFDWEEDAQTSVFTVPTA